MRQEASRGMAPPVELSSRLKAILNSETPAFSEGELSRRRQALVGLLAERECTHLVAYGRHGSGSAVQWITGWPATIEAAVLLAPSEQDLLLVQFYNHVPNARELAPQAEVRWGGASTMGTLVEALQVRSPAKKRLGLIGHLPHGDHVALEAVMGPIQDLTPEYRRFRMVKSEEEIDWFRLGAWLSDRAVEALAREVRPGLTEWDLAQIVESAYVSEGGTTLIHFFGVTAMHDPNRCVPAQHPSKRKIAKGDAIMTELSGSFWRHPGQVLRTFTVQADPSALYQRLHDVASSVFEEIFGRLKPGMSAGDLMEITGQIEDAGFTIYDDLVHGFDGEYLPPVLGTRSRPIHPVPDTILESGMTLVIQPNVITLDERAGVQTGELVLIKESGAESLHSVERGLIRIG